ncbi:TPA: hypothetical protein HA265_07940 [Candidatus Woesearchaeota archaeon]|nr:hypothetical protein [Candidatus Woesearchaeota archaeon]
MATFLDIGLVQHFSVIWPVLLIFVVIFALLEKSKIFGENKGLHSLIALSVAMMMLFVPGVVAVFSIMAPWFVLIMLLLMFFMITLLFFGTKPESIIKYASSWDTAHWFLLVIALIIFVGALGAVYGSAMLPYSGAGNVTASEGGVTGESTDTGDFNANVGRVIFHPKTLGMVFILLVASLAINFLGRSVKK